MTAAALLAIVAGAVGGPLAPAGELRHVYAGVACRTPNSIACDRLGLAVAVRPRPLRAFAVVDGRRIRLTASGAQWAGYVRDAGLERRLAASGAATDGSRWGGAAAPLIGGRVVATFADGHRALIPLLTRLRPGWG